MPERPLSVTTPWPRDGPFSPHLSYIWPCGKSVWHNSLPASSSTLLSQSRRLCLSLSPSLFQLARFGGEDAALHSSDL